MKRAFLHLYRKTIHSHPEVLIFGKGLERYGWTITSGKATDCPEHIDLLVQWGMRDSGLVKRTLDRGGETCILEMPYIEPRRQYVSVGFGYGINNRLRHYGPFDDDSRWNEHFAHRTKPWREPQEGPVLIMGQCPGDMALRGHEPFFYWVRDTFRGLKALGADPLFRPHPVMNARGLFEQRRRRRREWRTCVHADEEHIWTPWFEALDEGLQVMQDGTSLDQALNEASYVVTFNSNSGVDSVLHGVPAVTMDEGAMAWDVTGHALGEVIRPDREQWARAIAWKQWTHDEIERGICWDTVCPPHLR